MKILTQFCSGETIYIGFATKSHVFAPDVNPYMMGAKISSGRRIPVEAGLDEFHMIASSRVCGLSTQHNDV